MEDRRFSINYETYADFKKVFDDFKEGKISSIPCTECETGKIHSNPDVPMSNQCVFYCDNCNNKIIIDRKKI